MTKNYKIVTQFLRDISSETPNVETYFFVKNNISNYQLVIDITSKALKNKHVEIDTIFKFRDSKENEKKSYFEMTNVTVVKIDEKITAQIKKIEEAGFSKFPVCIAKTQYSFSTDPKLKGAPVGHSLPIREVRLSSGAEFVVVVCGAIMTMPGLPKVPAADSIKLNNKGEIEGLF